jgi:hypothetical protein
MAISSFQEASVAQLRAELGSKLNIAGGKILQIVRATDATERTTTSTSFVDANLSVTITPQKSDSTIHLLAFILCSPIGGRVELAITDSSNNVLSGAELAQSGTESTSGFTIYQTTAMMAVSTPAVITATTYKVRFRRGLSGTSRLLNSSQTAQLFAIEVSA